MNQFIRKFFLLFFFLELFLSFDASFASPKNIPKPQIDTLSFVVFKGVVVDHHTGSPLAFASILLKGTNISTVTNTEGSFSLKVPKEIQSGIMEISFLGYKTRTVPLDNLVNGLNTFELDALTLVLPEVSIVFSDAASLVREVIKRKGVNYSVNPILMTAFYRETIKKRKTYVSLQEAVVDVHKYPYTSGKQDWASLYKVRKKTDYQKLDTLVFKLMGGPYNTLFADVIKNSDDFFTDNMVNNYEFSFDMPTRIDDRTVYVVNFKQRSTYLDPLYYGKLFIEAQSLALIRAEFSLNLENREAAADIFVKKKPINAKVYPTKSYCRVDYVERGDRWYLNYCRVELDIYINWKKKLFNTSYSSTMEMAVTDWTASIMDDSWLKPKNKLKITAVVADEAAGFSDPAFWGDYNVIEPEKSIQSAIKKIQKQLKKN